MKRLWGNQRGFTLVELVAVVAIIVALAAVLVPNISRFAGSGQTAAAGSEVNALQAAMDTAMAESKLSAVSAQTGCTDFSSAGGKYFWDEDGNPATTNDQHYLYPDYLRIKNSGYGPYDWTAAGLVSKP